MSTITLQLETPNVPNFVRIKMPAGNRQDGFKEAPMIAICDLTDEQIESLVKDWKIKLYENARKQREVRKNL